MGTAMQENATSVAVVLPYMRHGRQDIGIPGIEDSYPRHRKHGRGGSIWNATGRGRPGRIPQQAAQSLSRLTPGHTPLIVQWVHVAQLHSGTQQSRRTPQSRPSPRAVGTEEQPPSRLPRVGGQSIQQTMPGANVFITPTRVLSPANKF
jgi:hypothetical protein